MTGHARRKVRRHFRSYWGADDPRQRAGQPAAGAGEMAAVVAAGMEPADAAKG